MDFLWQTKLICSYFIQHSDYVYQRHQSHWIYCLGSMQGKFPTCNLTRPLKLPWNNIPTLLPSDLSGVIWPDVLSILRKPKDCLVLDLNDPVQLLTCQERQKGANYMEKRSADIKQSKLGAFTIVKCDVLRIMLFWP